ncbi:MAG: hypothetical protein ACLT0Y_02970 [Christensenellales bacterium]
MGNLPKPLREKLKQIGLGGMKTKTHVPKTAQKVSSVVVTATPWRAFDENPSRRHAVHFHAGGCRMGCAFCRTQLGFRNLTIGEFAGNCMRSQPRGGQLYPHCAYGLREPDNYEHVVSFCVLFR